MRQIRPPSRPNFQDEFFLQLNNILVPVSGKEFEEMALQTAMFIAHEYGAKIDLLHVGKDPGELIEKFTKKYAQYEIQHNLTLIKDINVPRTIINYWKRFRHNLVILSARRRRTIFDKLTIPSVSNKVIPYIDTEVLQIYPPEMKKLRTKIKNIAVLLPYSNRDPFLLRWASAIAAPQKGAKIRVYHVVEIPQTVPITEAVDEFEVKKEEKVFKEYIKQYAEIFGHILRAEFVLGHDVLSSLEFIFEKHEPDLVLIGQTKQRKWWEKLKRPLSSKIKDKLKFSGICIHHMS